MMFWVESSVFGCGCLVLWEIEMRIDGLEGVEGDVRKKIRG